MGPRLWRSTCTRQRCASDEPPVASSLTDNSLGDTSAMIGTPGLASMLAIEYPGALAEIVVP